MKCILLTVATDISRTYPLKRSIDKFGWPYCIISCTWKGFGTKLLEVRNYLLKTPDITHFFFVDAYDVVLLGTMEEALSRLDSGTITFNAEKNCWPDKDLERFYEPVEQGRWSYLNSGAYFAPRDQFLSLFNKDMPDYLTDDQRWATNQYLFNDEASMAIDRNCDVFQCYSFIAEDDFGYENGRLLNLKTGTSPLIIHGNGTTNMDKVIELI